MNRQLNTFIEAEQRVKISHFTQQGFDIKGVIHVGAHDGEEVQYYQRMGIDNILCFEPIPGIVNLFKETYPDVKIYKMVLGTENKKVNFNITNDGRQGQASSLYEPLLEQYAMTGGVKEVISVEMQRFDTFLSKHKVNPNDYDCVVIDVQGAELDVLIGMGAYIENYKYYNIECSEQATYLGGATAAQVIDYMDKHGFIQDSPIFSHDDIFFVRKDIKSESDKIYRGLS